MPEIRGSATGNIWALSRRSVAPPCVVSDLGRGVGAEVVGVVDGVNQASLAALVV